MMHCCKRERDVQCILRCTLLENFFCYLEYVVVVQACKCAFLVINYI